MLCIDGASALAHTLLLVVRSNSLANAPAGAGIAPTAGPKTGAPLGAQSVPLFRLCRRIHFFHIDPPPLR